MGKQSFNHIDALSQLQIEEDCAYVEIAASKEFAKEKVYSKAFFTIWKQYKQDEEVEEVEEAGQGGDFRQISKRNLFEGS